MWLGYFFVLVVKMEMMKLWFNITSQIYDIQFSNCISNVISLVLVVLIFKRRFGLWGIVLLPGMFVRKAWWAYGEGNVRDGLWRMWSAVWRIAFLLKIMSLTFEIIPQIILFIPLIVFAVLLILQRRWGMLQTGSGFVAVSSGEKVVG